MRTLYLLILIASPLLAQEHPTLASEFPFTEKVCHITRENYAGHDSWRAHCKLRVYKRVSETETEGYDLFDMALIQALPATLSEANKAVEIWMNRTSQELLKRNGYMIEQTKRSKKK